MAASTCAPDFIIQLHNIIVDGTSFRILSLKIVKRVTQSPSGRLYPSLWLVSSSSRPPTNLQNNQLNIPSERAPAFHPREW